MRDKLEEIIVSEMPDELVKALEEGRTDTYKVWLELSEDIVAHWIDQILKLFNEVQKELIDEVWFTLQGNPENNDQWIADQLKDIKERINEK